MIQSPQLRTTTFDIGLQGVSEHSARMGLHFVQRERTVKPGYVQRHTTPLSKKKQRRLVHRYRLLVVGDTAQIIAARITPIPF